MTFLRIRFDLAVVVACLVTLGTFGWHGFMGKRGLPYRTQLEQQREELQTRLDGLKKDHAVFEKKLALLRPESVDPDLVDELVRSHLGLVRSNDLVIFTGSLPDDQN